MFGDWGSIFLMDFFIMFIILACLASPVVGLVMAVVTNNLWWLLLLIPGVIYLS